MVDYVLFCVLRDRDYFFCCFGSVFYSEMVGEAVKPFCHFMAGEQGKSKIVDCDNIWSAIENWDVEMGEMNDIAVFSF